MISFVSNLVYHGSGGVIVFLTVRPWAERGS